VKMLLDSDSSKAKITDIGEAHLQGDHFHHGANGERERRKPPMSTPDLNADIVWR
jgi:hypothetical protein